MDGDDRCCNPGQRLGKDTYHGLAGLGKVCVHILYQGDYEVYDVKEVITITNLCTQCSFKPR